MRKLVLVTAAAVVMGAPLALADNMSGNTIVPPTHTKTDMALLSRCAMLDEKFEDANAMRRVSSYAPEAVVLHTEGETLCSSHQPAAGAEYLASALKIMHAQSRM
jgi:hypothetical protein